MFEQYHDLMTAQEVQAALQLGRSKTYALLKDGQIPCITIGRQIRVPKRSLIDYVADLRYNDHGIGCRERSNA